MVKVFLFVGPQQCGCFKKVNAFLLIVCLKYGTNSFFPLTPLSLADTLAGVPPFAPGTTSVVTGTPSGALVGTKSVVADTSVGTPSVAIGTSVGTPSNVTGASSVATGTSVGTPSVVTSTPSCILVVTGTSSVTTCTSVGTPSILTGTSSVATSSSVVTGTSNSAVVTSVATGTHSAVTSTLSVNIVTNTLTGALSWSWYPFSYHWYFSWHTLCWLIRKTVPLNMAKISG